MTPLSNSDSRRNKKVEQLTQTVLNKSLALVRKFAPKRFADWVRRVGTAILTPIIWSIRSGHFKSSLKAKAVDRHGEALPWYTYPCVDFIQQKDFTDCSVLEFGAGQSTLWWASQASSVLALEGDAAWHDHLKSKVPNNVKLERVSATDPESCIKSVTNALKKHGNPKFDVIVIDGLWRHEMVPISQKHLASTGFILCDNSLGYRMHTVFKGAKFKRVDFFGIPPGVSAQNVSSIFFTDKSTIFDNDQSGSA